MASQKAMQGSVADMISDALWSLLGNKYMSTPDVRFAGVRLRKSKHQ